MGFMVVDLKYRGSWIKDTTLMRGWTLALAHIFCAIFSITFGCTLVDSRNFDSKGEDEREVPC